MRRGARAEEEQFAHFLLGLEQQTLPNEQSIQFADKYLKKWAFCPLLENSLHCDLSNYLIDLISAIKPPNLAGIIENLVKNIAGIIKK